MSNADEPAYPTPHFQNANGDIQWGANGMTLRQAFVMAAMQGLCANSAYAYADAARIAGWAVETALATLAAMEKEPL